MENGVSMLPVRRSLFVHANTFLEKEQVVVKEYKGSSEGIIQSWSERALWRQTAEILITKCV